MGMWTARFHGGPAAGQEFEVELEPAALLSMEQDTLEGGQIQAVVYLYRRTLHDPARQHCEYHLTDAQAAFHTTGTRARN